MPKQANLTISGHVQGVFYRDTTQEKAIELDICGWVRNMPDGSVEACFQGDPEQVEQLIAWCKEGPSVAVVDEVEVEWEDTDDLFDEFEIRY